MLLVNDEASTESLAQITSIFCVPKAVACSTHSIKSVPERLYELILRGHRLYENEETTFEEGMLQSQSVLGLMGDWDISRQAGGYSG